MPFIKVGLDLRKFSKSSFFSSKSPVYIKDKVGNVLVFQENSSMILQNTMKNF